ncbi:Translation initiation factor 3 subunit c [Entomophthora muscae]|uniref:Translation initiation factor 3 subunit c n=1 Tax=Entomophthora muscae TaxID=34485 RepID=A0ACC2RE75_9FUNG|nr:Translation initiation factor 3 subunit c [Entomophthora muscae]
MSRFFRGDSDSETESSSSDDSLLSDEQSQSESESEVEEQEDEDDDKRPANAWLKGDSSDSDSDGEVKQVVKSAKDKRFDEIETCVKAIDNSIKINDWVSLSNEYEKMNKVVSKLKVASLKPPTSYFQGLINLEDALQTAASEKKKMNATNAKAMNSMKQKLKKNNRDFEEQIKRVRSGEDLDEKVTVVSTPKVKKAPKVQEVAEESDSDDGFTQVGKGGKKVTFSPDMVMKKLKEIVQARGKKNTDKDEQVAILLKLFAVAATPRHKIKILFSLISSRFDYGTGLVAFCPANIWQSALKEVIELFSILESHTELNISEKYEEVDEEEPESKDLLDIQGSVISLIERLDDEFTKSLQNTDPHTSEYLERLSDETSLIQLITRAHQYFEYKGQTQEATRAIIRRIEHLYYKSDSLVIAIEEKTKPFIGPFHSNLTKGITDPLNLISSMCSYLYKHADPLLRTRAMLYHIYSVALHGQYHIARDMLLMSHLQETIHQADVATMILFNRAMCQIGIAAFKKGLLKESLNCIQEIYNTGRVKDLLAQGITVQRHANVNLEQEKLEKLRMLPFHMHINLELLECIYLTCSMLLEIPNMARAGSNPDARKTLISKPFRRLLEQNNRQIFSGPPENTREHIIAAAKALSAGEWEASRKLIWDIKIWDLLKEKDHIKALIGKRIQEEGLRTYLFSYSAYYNTLSLQQLATMFDLSLQSVNSLLCKMIWNEELVAGLDQVKGIVVLHSEQLSKVQLLSVMVGEKLANLAECNQKAFDQKMSDLDSQYSSQDRRGQRGPNNAQGKKQIDHSYNSKKPNRNNFNQTRRAVQ